MKVSRAFSNFTTEPIEFKTWLISADQVKENHFPMLKSHNIPARWQPDQSWLNDVNGARWRYGVHGRAEFDTTTKEQEVLLKLLYGDKLVLMLVEIVLPGNISHRVTEEA